MVVSPNFHFARNCIEAIQVYEKAFHTATLCVIKNEDADSEDYVAPDRDASLVYHAEMMIGGTRVMMSDITEDAEHQPGNSVSLVITFYNVSDLKSTYDIMKEGAVILTPMQSTTYSSCFVSLIDRFGMRWEFMTEQRMKKA